MENKIVNRCFKALYALYSLFLLILIVVMIYNAFHFSDK